MSDVDKRVIYSNDDGGVSILIPSPNALKEFSIDDLAKKDVPYYIDAEGNLVQKPYKIIESSDLPQDREFRDAWEYQE
jgi:hypothetical protein